MKTNASAWNDSPRAICEWQCICRKGRNVDHTTVWRWVQYYGPEFSVYFGKLTGFGTPSPVLTDVFYIVSQTNPETKQVTNVLVKRGKELHGPDRMYLNASSIVFVEPVGADSKVAQLISEASKQ
jgi:hypothetical protein